MLRTWKDYTNNIAQTWLPISDGNNAIRRPPIRIPIHTYNIQAYGYTYINVHAYKHILHHINNNNSKQHTIADKCWHAIRQCLLHIMGTTEQTTKLVMSCYL